MQYQVPQFIETEDKIIGPLTIKQFLILAAAGAISFLTFFVFQTWLWVMTTIFFGGIASFFAFIRINGQPSYLVMFSAFAYLWKPRFFLWQKKEELAAPADVAIVKSLEEKRRFPLRSLWNKILTTTQNITNREKSSPAGQSVQTKQTESGMPERNEVKRIDYR